MKKTPKNNTSNGHLISSLFFIMYIINFGLFCSNARNETKQPVAIRFVSWSRSAKHRQVSVHDPRPNIISSSSSYIGPRDERIITERP